MIKFKKLKKIDQIKQFDKLIISDGKNITLETASIVKISEYDGTEVIFNIELASEVNDVPP